MKSSIRNNIALISILIIAAILRFYHCNYQSLWLDEIHTINEASPSTTLKELYKILAGSDPHPPLYFLLVRTSFILFGYTALTLRLVSVVLGIAGVWSIYILGHELYNKKAGLIAALLLSVNHFHIYYSQDARPYPLLFLCTTLSFYFLVRFIKDPTIKSSILYGIFTGLMLYSHLFSLFALCSQCAILLCFLIWPYSSTITQKKMFLYCLISGAVVIVMYLPCLEIFLNAASTSSMWIPKPKPDAYVHLLKAFFGKYDVQLFFGAVALLFFFIGLVIERRQKIKPPVLKLCSVILLLWIIITLLIPWIKSYIGVSIIINRYFINILPAIILLIAIGIMQLKNKYLIYALAVTMVILSLYNIFILKKYYDTINKTQFREAVSFISVNNINNAPVVSSLQWYLPFYINQDNKKHVLVYKSLEDYVEDMAAGTCKISPFWYIDGHNRDYNPSKKAKDFLEANFVVEYNYQGYDIWTKYYVPVKNYTNTYIEGFSGKEQKSGDEITYNLEHFEISQGVIKVSGWAFLSGIDSSASQIRICLIKDGKIMRIPTLIISRTDISKYFKLEYKADTSGFVCDYNTNDVAPGKYKIGIYIENKHNSKKGLIITDKTFFK